MGSASCAPVVSGDDFSGINGRLASTGCETI